VARPQEFQNFDEVIHWLYDNTDVLVDADGSVGYYLRTPEEASALHPLHKALDLRRPPGTRMSIVRAPAELWSSPRRRRRRNAAGRAGR